jgi:hypothetical protein
LRDHTQLRAFELADEVVMLVYRTTTGVSKRRVVWPVGFLGNEDFSSLEPKVVETEKVLNGLIRALRDHVQPSALTP